MEGEHYSISGESSSAKTELVDIPGSHCRRIKIWTFRLAEFGLFQAAVQALTAVAGFLIVRTLSKHEYALYAVTNSMQTACNSLADLGVGIGVRSIGGRVWNEPARFGQLLTTAVKLRGRLALMSLSFCLPIAIWMLCRNNANPFAATALSLVIVASVIPLLGTTAWGASAQLHGEYRRIQKLDLGNAAMRCAFIVGLAYTHLNAVLATLVGAVGNWIQMIFLRRWAREKIATNAPVNIDDRSELLRLSLKSLPNNIFYSFQGQITLFILTLFGNTTGIADITAMGRIAILLTIFSVTFTNVLAPRFMRCQDKKRLPRLYFLLVGGAAVVLLIPAIVAGLFPGPFMVLLGSKYSNLGTQCGWVMAAACIGQLINIMWNLNSSKAWIHIQAFGLIPSVLAAQVVAAMVLDLRQFHNVLIFNFVSVAAILPVLTLDAFFGLRDQKQRR